MIWSTYDNDTQNAHVDTGITATVRVSKRTVWVSFPRGVTAVRRIEGGSLLHEAERIAERLRVSYHRTPELYENSDWQYVFEYSSGRDESGNGGQTPEHVLVNECDTAPFDTEDVARVLHMAEGDNDGEPWVIVVRLRDGRFGYIKAGCDYTGWDCRAGGTSYVARSLDLIERFACDESDRKRLGIVLDEGASS